MMNKSLLKIKNYLKRSEFNLKTKNNKIKSNKEQLNSLNLKNNPEINSNYYGDDDNISTQIVTNYYYTPDK